MIADDDIEVTQERGSSATGRRFRRLIHYLPLTGLIAALAFLAAFAIFNGIHRDRTASVVENNLALSYDYLLLRNAVADASQALLIYHDSLDRSVLQSLRPKLIQGLLALDSIAARGGQEDRDLVETLRRDYLPGIESYLAGATVAPGAPIEVPTKVPLEVRIMIDARAEAAHRSSEQTLGNLGERSRIYSRLELAVMAGTLILALILGLSVWRAGKREARFEREKRDAARRTLAQSERRFRALVQNSTDAILITDRLGRTTYVSPACEAVTGRSPEDLLGKQLPELVHEQDRPTAAGAMEALLRDPSRATSSLVVRLGQADGGQRHLEVRGANLLLDPAVGGLVFNVRDISERIASTAASVRLSAVFEATKDMVFVTSPRGEVLNLNRTAREALGVRDSAPQTLYTLLPDHIADQFMGVAIPAAARDGSWEGEVRLTFAGRAETAVEVEILAHMEDDGAIDCFSCLLRDVTDQRHFEARLAFLASHDELTGLPNRRFFEEQVAAELARSRMRGKHGSILVIDLDGLKTVNDDLGHVAGDELLRGAARILKDATPDRGLCARIGGDEFAMLLPGKSESEASAIAEQLRLSIRSERLNHCDEELSTTASIGVASFPDHGDDVEEILANADLAMYEAKSSRDAWRVFSLASAQRAEMSERRIWEKLMRDALDQERFVFMAQPLREIEGEIVMYELLLRMERPDRSLVQPSVFLPIAERSGLVVQVDRYVVHKAIEMIAESQAADHPVTLAVNVSGRSLGDDVLPGLIEAWLNESGVDPSLLVIEVTETAAIAGIERGNRFVDRLKHLGVRVAIDDFGAGFSSFTYIKNLQVSHVKIDGSFIRNLATNEDDQHVVRAMIDLAHSLGKRVVAEFVEDDATLNLLASYGVDMVQGYHLGRPARVELLIGVSQPGERAHQQAA